MLNKSLKKKKQTKEIRDTKDPKKKSIDNTKLLGRQLSHVILTEPKPRHKRQFSHISTNHQSTSQKITYPIDLSNRKMIESSSKKLTTKSKKSVKETKVKKFQSYLLYIDTQFSLFSQQTKSKISDESTDVRRDISSIEQKDDLVQMIKKHKREYISQSQNSQMSQNQTIQDKAANNIKNKWKLYKTRKLISKYIKLNKIRHRPQNIPSNINKLESLHEIKSILSIQTIRSQQELPPNQPSLAKQSSFQEMVVQISSGGCLQNLKLKQIQQILINQKHNITQKYSFQVQEIEGKYHQRKLTRAQYQTQLKNANKFMGLRMSQINQSILNIKKLYSQTDVLLNQVRQNNIGIDSPLKCYSEQDMVSSHGTFKSRQETLAEKQKIVDDLIDSIFYEFCKETQKHPYMQKIIIQSFADWKIGVQTNQDSIDLFCQNLIQYTLSNENPPFHNLKVSLGCTPNQLLKIYHTPDFEPDKEEDVVLDNIFRDFSKIMVFPLKSKNSLEQLSIVRLIQILNHYHSRAIFEALNQALDYERVYGIVGKPLPWKPQPNFKKFHLYQSLSSAVDRVISYQQWRCGFHCQNFFLLRPGLTMRNLSVVREQRLNKLLQVEQKQLQPYWQNDQMQQTFLLLDLNHLVNDFMIIEVALQLQLIFQTR